MPDEIKPITDNLQAQRRKKDRIRVVRIIEMEGPREWVEATLGAPGAFLQCRQPRIFAGGRSIEEKIRITEVIAHGE